MPAPPKDPMRGLLALVLLGCFMAALFWLMRWAVPEANRDLVNFMLGQLSIFASGAIVYYFGTSQSSAEKNAIIREQQAQHDRSDPPPPRPPLDLPSPTFGKDAP